VRERYGFTVLPRQYCESGSYRGWQELAINVDLLSRRNTESMHSKQVLHEPLLHFFVLGVLLFALFSWINDDAMRAPDEIVIDAARVAALESQFERVWQRPPSPDEMAGLVDNWIREEVLYREGMALGLDRDDPILRRRVVQKMDFISEDLADSQPTKDELRDFFAANSADYRLDSRFSFTQLYFDPAAHGNSLEATVARALDAVVGGRQPESDATLLPAELSDVSFSDVRRTFGDRFAEALAGLPVGDWVGPLTSGYGVHLVRLDQKQEARLPEFDAVRAAVERDFRAEQGRERKDAIFDKLRQRYTITFEDGTGLADERDGVDRVR